MTKLIETRRITQQGEKGKVIREISFDIQKGDITGILGPFEAGKTTLLEILSCQIQPSSGEIFINHIDAKKFPQKIRKIIGFVPEKGNLDKYFSALDNLILFASYFKIPKKQAVKKSMDLLRLLNLEEMKNKMIEELSLLQMKELILCRGLVNSPEILFVDEPTKGLGNVEKVKIRKLMSKIKQMNKTIVLATEDIEDLENLCDRILILSKGKIVADGRPKELVKEYIGHEVVELTFDYNDIDYYMTKLGNEFEVAILPNSLRLFLNKNQSSQEVVKRFPSTNIRIRKVTLEDFYVRTMDKESVEVIT